MVNAAELLRKGIARIRKSQPVSPDIPDFVTDIRSAIKSRTQAHEAKEWLSTPFTQTYLAFLEGEAEASHQALLNGTLSGEAYREVYLFIAKLSGYPHLIVRNGATASEYLKQCQEDGTLREAELYHGIAEE